MGRRGDVMHVPDSYYIEYAMYSHWKGDIYPKMSARADEYLLMCTVFPQCSGQKLEAKSKTVKQFYS